MSVDAFGRVIVGSGHFANQVPVIVERTLNMAQHVIVGGGHNQIFPAVAHVWSAAGRGLQQMNDLMLAPAQVPSAQSSVRYVDYLTMDQRVEFEQRQWDNIKQAGLDIAQALGYGAAGQLPEAQEKAVDAAVKVGENILERFLDNIRQIQDWFPNERPQ